jgi:serine protease Do
VTDDIARSFGLTRAHGALVSDVMSGGPAEKAGIKQGDIITGVNGKSIANPRQLQMMVADIPAGQKVDIEIFRNGKTEVIPVTLASTDSAAAHQPRAAGSEAGMLGMTIEELPQHLRARGLSGVIVTEVEPDGAAAEAGIRQGDIIVSVNRKKVGSLSDYGSAMKEAERTGTAALLVKRGGQSIYFAVKIR